MHLLKTDCRFCQRMRLLLIMLLAALAIYFSLMKLPEWISPSTTPDQWFWIENIHSHLVKQHFYLDADVHMDFPPTVNEALQNGVPLTIRLELEILQLGDWQDKLIKRSTRDFELRFHALTNTYGITNKMSKKEFFFESRSLALKQLGQIRNAHLISMAELEPAKQHIARHRVLLDIWSLPPELQHTAALSSSWRLQSKWTQWKLN